MTQQPTGTPASEADRLWTPDFLRSLACLLVPLAGVAGGIVGLAAQAWPAPVFMIAGSVAIAAVERAALPPRLTRLLAARSRGFDVALLLIVAASIAAVGVMPR